MLQILHNPRCGKSRNCLATIKEANVPFEVILYLVNPLTVEALKILIKKLGIKPIALVRQKEAIWIEKYKDKTITDSQIIKAIAKHPILMQRPILIVEELAIIGCGSESLSDLFNKALG